MSYEPFEWVDGETPIVAERLNALEQGVKEASEAAQKAAQRPRGLAVTRKAWDELLARVEALEGRSG